MTLDPAWISAAILIAALILFVSERVRHDLIAVGALIACVAAGLVAPEAALAGFGDPAVATVAAVLIVGRALEMTGVAARLAQIIIPAHAGFSTRLSLLIVVAAALSAFMNNIAALVITMPLATEIARSSNRHPSTTLMPLAFASILGGMTTLIGTPANLILSSVRERELGAPFGFFAMTPVGVAVCAAGLAYLGLIGWRLLPNRRGAGTATARPWRVFEIPIAASVNASRATIAASLRSVRTRLLTVIRHGRAIGWPADDSLRAGDRMLVLSRSSQTEIAPSLDWAHQPGPMVAGLVTARMAVAFGSPLIGDGHESIPFLSGGRLSVVALGPRAAKLKRPLAALDIQSGDQLFVQGRPEDLGAFAARMRLLEIDRVDTVPVNVRAAIMTVTIFGAAIATTILGGITPAITFLAAAAAIAGLRLIAPGEIYASIDWSVIVLLAAMIPVGASFETSGAAAILAGWLGQVLADAPLVVALAAVCTATLTLSIFLNNVATSVIMGPLAIKVAMLLGIAPDAMLLAVLIGASSDFLTPIGHQNNLLVMGPGGYRFTDYARAGALLSLIVVAIASIILAYGFA
ncbi:MAG: citrate transporter [Sphingomonas sp. 28-66-16]|nr:MAG: citrate transporter [Sphingomonas sp. 28-66-16]